MTTLTNNLQRVFKTLYDSNRPLYKKEIAEILGSTEYVIANNLSVLTRSDWAAQSNGRYIITPLGREQYKENPYIMMPSKRKQTELIGTMKLDWDYIRSSDVCMSAIEIGESNVDNEMMKRELLPIVLVWLGSMGQKFPKLTSDLMFDERDEIRIDLLEKFFKDLANIDNPQPPKDVINDKGYVEPPPLRPL